MNRVLERKEWQLLSAYMNITCDWVLFQTFSVYMSRGLVFIPSGRNNCTTPRIIFIRWLIYL